MATPTWDDTEDLEEKYGGLSGSIKAGTAGALRGASLGLSDQFLVKNNLVKKQTLKGLQEENPISSVGGEIVGTIAPAFIGEEGSLANIPGLVSKVGKGVSRGVARELPQASSMLGRMATTAAATGSGLAAEGAVYGLGQSISENALGDHDLVSEKTLANIGMSAALTGGFGALVGGAFGAVGKDLVSGEERVAALRATEGLSSGEADLAGTVSQPKERLSFIQSLRKQKENAAEILAAGEEIGAPVLPGQTSASKHIQDATSALSKAPTLPGITTQQTIQKGFDAVDNVIKDSLGAAEHLEAYDAGAALKESVQNKIDEIYAPIKQRYKDREAIGHVIKLPDDEIIKFHDRLIKAGSGFKNVTNEGRAIFKQVARDVVEEAVQSAGASGTSAISNLEGLAKSLGDKARAAEAPMVKNYDLAQAYYQNRDMIKKFINRQLLGAEREAGSLEGRQAKEIIKEGRALDKEYKNLKSILKDVFTDQRLGKRKNISYGDLDNVLDGIANEKVVDKMFDPKNSDGLKRFKENFPDAFQIMIDHKKSQLLQNSTKDGKVEIGKVMREIYDEKKLSSKVREIMFTPEQLKKMDAAKTWVESMPKDINPSGTDKATAYREFLSNPLKAVSGNLVSFTTKALIEKLAKTPEEASKLMTIINTEKEAMKTSKRISQGISRVFDQSKDSLAPKIFSKIASPEEYKERTKEVKEMANNMVQFSDKISESTNAYYQHAPNVGQSLQGGMIRGVQFLNSKIPQAPMGLFEAQFEPSTSEIADFNRYYNLVEDPVSALEQVDKGTLTSETIETLSAVYPKLYQEMQTQMLDKITSIKDPSKVPYQTRMAVSMFLGQPLDSSFSPASIQANQMSFAENNQQMAAQNPMQASAKPAKMDKMTLAGRTGLNRGNMDA